MNVEDHKEGRYFICCVMCSRNYKIAKKLRSKLQVQGKIIILIARRTMGDRGSFVRDVFGIGLGKDIIVGTADMDVNTSSGTLSVT
jgi:hypothetical protein